MTIEKFFGTVQNGNGKALVGASVRIYLHGTTTDADLLEDDETTPLANPQATDGYGGFAFCIAHGTYDISIQLGSYSRSYEKVTMGSATGAGSLASLEDTVVGTPSSFDLDASANPVLTGTTSQVFVYVGGFRWPSSLVSVSFDLLTITVATDATNLLIDGDLIHVDYIAE